MHISRRTPVTDRLSRRRSFGSAAACLLLAAAASACGGGDASPCTPHVGPLPADWPTGLPECIEDWPVFPANAR